MYATPLNGVSYLQWYTVMVYLHTHAGRGRSVGVHGGGEGGEGMPYLGA